MNYLLEDNLEFKLRDAIEGYIADCVENGCLDFYQGSRDTDDFKDILFEKLFNSNHNFAEFVADGEYIENSHFIQLIQFCNDYYEDNIDFVLDWRRFNDWNYILLQVGYAYAIQHQDYILDIWNQANSSGEFKCLK